MDRLTKTADRYLGSTTVTTVSEELKALRDCLLLSPVVLALADTELRYCWVYNSLGGFSEAELIGKTAIQIVDNNATRAVMRLEQRAMQQGSSQQQEIEFRCSKETHSLNVVAEPIRDEAGHIQGVRVAASDVTKIQKKRMEMLRLQEDYLRLVSHDLQGPLQVILSACSLMEAAALAGDIAAARSFAGRVRASAASMSKAVREIVEVGILEEAIELDKHTIDVKAFIYNALEVGVPPAERERLTIDAAVGLEVEADEPKLQRAFLNLVNNALKYSPADKTIQVRVECTPQTLRLSVEDRGPGMSPADMEGLFQKYRRVPRLKKTEGAGLGLYACKLVVSAHGGRCWVESAPGRGSTFILELPGKLRSSLPPAHA